MNNAQKTLAGALLVGGSLLTGNATTLAVAGGLGVNLASTGLEGMAARLGQAMQPGTPLAQAYARSIRKATQSLQRDYQRAQDDPDGSAFTLVAASANSIAQAAYPPILTVTTAQQALHSSLDGLLHGHAVGSRAYLEQHLLAQVALTFRDELAAEPEAWQRYHGWLIEEIWQQLRAQGSPTTASVPGTLADADALLQEMSARWQAFEANVYALHQAALAQATGNTLNTAGGAVIYGNVTVKQGDFVGRDKISGSQHTYNNSGITVQGNLNQGTNTSTSRPGTTEQDET